MNERLYVFGIFLILLLFVFFLFLVSLIAPGFMSLRTGFLGNFPFANFDGKHYLSIAKRGYLTYEQAFFPLFPLAIRYFSKIFSMSRLISAIILVYLFFFLALIYFYKLLRLDYDNKTCFWSILFLVSFPTAFFLGSIYTEGLFLFLIFSSIFYARKRKFLLAVLLGAFASATRLLGILVILPIFYEALSLYKENKKDKRLHKIAILILPFFPGLGIFSYMFFLYKRYQDAFLFMHVQPFFGANRSGGKIISIFQIIYRYVKIFLTVPFAEFSLYIAILEFITFFLVLYLIYLSYKKNVRISYVLFSFLALFIPTLSGTLSSIPRYALVSFSIFPTLAMIKSFRLKIVIIVFDLVLESILLALFLRGYFVS